MTLKSFVVVSAILAAFGASAAYAQSRAQTSAAAPAAATPATPPAAGTATPSSVVAPVGGYPLSSEYIIGPEDVLQITVWKDDALSRTLPVRPDGKISMPLLNDIPAAGLSPLQLRDSITEKLKKYIADPRVTVVVTAMNSRRVFVTGEVVHSGPMALLPHMTMLQALSQAGFSQFANLTAIYLLHAFKRRGIGRALLTGLWGALAASGHRSAGLWVLVNNHGTRRFYEAVGGRAGATRLVTNDPVEMQEIAYIWDDLSRLQIV